LRSSRHPAAAAGQAAVDRREKTAPTSRSKYYYTLNNTTESGPSALVTVTVR
jgi:hypothetical protein